MHAVEVERLRKQFDPPNGPVAANGLTFHIREGEIFSLLGPNGAGKSTVIAILSSLLIPDAGDARIGGYSITREAEKVRELIGVVPQEVALYEDLSGRENLLFWGRMYGLRGTTLESRVDAILQLIGLVDRQKDRVGKYSGGMKRRVNIGAALLHQPRILYLDEPTVGIDPQSRRAILEGVKDLNRQGVTILYTTHYMEEAQELSDRIAIIDHGSLIALGSHEELVHMVGEATHVRIALDGAVETLADRWSHLPGVRQITSEEGHLSLLADGATSLMPRLLEDAQALKVRITDINLGAPTLETVFLHLTGRALRD